MTNRKRWGWLLLSALIVGGVYARLLRCGFLLYDDPDYVTANTHLFDGITLHSLRWALTATHSCNWHPLTWFSHLLDVQLYWFNPVGHHLTSLLLHDGNFLLLATLLWRLTGAFGKSLTVALLFALHPLHVESVAWIAERKDVLSAFFWLLTLHLYIWYMREGGKGRYLLALLSFSLGLMAKPMVVTLPVILLILDYWPLNRTASSAAAPAVPLRRLVLEKLPFFILAALVGVVTYAVQSKGGAVDLTSQSLPVNAGNALISYATYLVKTCWPVGLSFIYPFHPDLVTAPRVAAAVLLLGAVSVPVAFAPRQHRYLAAGWLWYLVTLLPVIGFVRVGDQALADRYTYLPLIGIFIMVVWGGGAYAAGVARRERALGVVAVLVLLVLGGLTWRQTGYWQNGLTLNRHALQVTDRNWAAHYNLGGELNETGDVEGAIHHYREAIRLFPGNDRSHYNLGKIFLSLDNPAEAVTLLATAVRLNPDFVDARRYLGFAWLRLGRDDLARDEYRRLVPFDAVAAASLLNSITLYSQAADRRRYR